MRLQVLVSTMNQKDYSLLDRMNIQSDAIVINQCDRNKIEKFNYKGCSIIWISLNERGIGLSRNTALMRATGDIVLFADDDVEYVDGYPEIIENAFKNHEADVILFDFKVKGSSIYKPREYKYKRIRWYNSMHFGAIHFACKRDKLYFEGIFFNLLFGGGAKYSCGEDNIFLSNVLKSGLKIITVPNCIGSVTFGDSTWFKGFNEKYFYDKGILLGNIFRKKAYILMLFLLLKNSDQTRELGFKKSLKISLRGIKEANVR